MKVNIIGTGNVATVLGKMIRNAGHEILQVCGRTPSTVTELATLLGAEACYDFTKSSPDADLYLIAISDKALNQLPGDFTLDKKLVVHTAGSVPKDILSGISAFYGVLYPLQTLRKEIDMVTDIPFLVDGNNEEVKARLLSFAGELSSQVRIASDAERLKLHLAAIVVNNFTNHLLAIARDWCEKENLDFTLLYPLIEETVKRAESNAPKGLQTGPAIRGDEITVQKHLKLLQGQPALKTLYEQFTRSIKDFHGMK